MIFQLIFLLQNVSVGLTFIVGVNEGNLRHYKHAHSNMQ